MLCFACCCQELDEVSICSSVAPGGHLMRAGNLKYADDDDDDDDGTASIRSSVTGLGGGRGRQMVSMWSMKTALFASL